MYAVHYLLDQRQTTTHLKIGLPSWSNRWSAWIWTWRGADDSKTRVMPLRRGKISTNFDNPRVAVTNVDGPNFGSGVQPDLERPDSNISNPQFGVVCCNKQTSQAG
jgi:hypothetical protein